MHRRPWFIGLAAIAILLTALAVILVRGRQRGFRLEALPEGITTRTVEGTPLFLIRHGNEVHGYLDDAQHLPGERLWWCPAEAVFVSPFHGELFTADGRFVAGPGSADLDRVAVEVTGDGLVEIDPFSVQQGVARTTEHPGWVERKVWRAYSFWARKGSWSRVPFCEQHVAGKSNLQPRA